MRNILRPHKSENKDNAARAMTENNNKRPKVTRIHIGGMWHATRFVDNQRFALVRTLRPTKYIQDNIHGGF